MRSGVRAETGQLKYQLLQQIEIATEKKRNITMPRLISATLTRLRLPLVRPYRLSYRTFEEFEPFVVQLGDSDGREGFADAHISPGSSSETREGGWKAMARMLGEGVGHPVEALKQKALSQFVTSKGAMTAIASAVEVLERNALLDVQEPARLPLLVPINSLEEKDIVPEVDRLLDQGFRTFKVKVGKDVEADLARVQIIQRAVAGRATLRLDANRAFDRDQGIAFASKLDPTSIELFEQPCESDQWEANAAVAAASTVPLMLDEPICTLDDIERAGTIRNVGFCKLKLKRFGGLERLAAGLGAVRENGMEPVLGDGLGSEIHGWLEACVARGLVRNAGEYNGFLKPHGRLFENALPFAEGVLTLPKGYWPVLSGDAFESARLDRLTFPHS